MTLDFGNNETYTKETVLANVRYALFDPKSLKDEVISAEFLDIAAVFVLIDATNPDKPRYKIIDAVDMVSLDIRLKEIMDAANENCKKIGYNIMLMEDVMSEITGTKIPSNTFCPMYIGTNPERILGASILIRCAFNVQSHAGRGDLVLDIAGDLRQPTAVSYALCLHRWSNRKTQGIFPACEICNDEICLEGIIPTLGTFDRCVKALHVYAEVSSCFCHGGYAPFCHLRCGGVVIVLAPPQCWGRRPFR